MIFSTITYLGQKQIIMGTFSKLMASTRCLLSTTYHSIIGMITPKKRMNRLFVDQKYLAWSQSLLKGAKVHCEVSGPLPAHEVTTLVMCNHRSLFDIPLAIYALKGRVRMVAKAELRRIPIFGHVMEKIGCVIIDRQHARVAKRQLATATQQLSGQCIWCAPEGTRNPGSGLLPFKKGVFRLAQEANAQIVPMMIEGSEQILPKKHCLVNPMQHVRVTIGAPIKADEVARLTPQALMALVRERMEAL